MLLKNEIKSDTRCYNFKLSDQKLRWNSFSGSIMALKLENSELLGKVETKVNPVHGTTPTVPK